MDKAYGVFPTFLLLELSFFFSIFLLGIYHFREWLSD